MLQCTLTGATGLLFPVPVPNKTMVLNNNPLLLPISVVMILHARPNLTKEKVESEEVRRRFEKETKSGVARAQPHLFEELLLRSPLRCDLVLCRQPRQLVERAPYIDGHIRATPNVLRQALGERRVRKSDEVAGEVLALVTVLLAAGHGLAVLARKAGESADRGRVEVALLERLLLERTRPVRGEIIGRETKVSFSTVKSQLLEST